MIDYPSERGRRGGDSGGETKAKDAFNMRMEEWGGG